MSCSFDLRCSTCNATTSLDLNWGGDALANALLHRAALEAYGAAFAEVDKTKDGWHLTSEGTSTKLERMARWLAQHIGHAVIVEDEYGKIHGSCGADVNCECGSRHYCRLPPKHDGEHRR